MAISDFRTRLQKLLSEAEANGATAIEINAGKLHRAVGGYPAEDGKHEMPSCCEAMYQLRKPQDEILSSPPKGKGATLTIRYLLD